MAKKLVVQVSFAESTLRLLDTFAKKHEKSRSWVIEQLVLTSNWTALAAAIKNGEKG